MMLPAGVERHIQHMVDHSLGLTVPPESLFEMLRQTDDSKRRLEAQVLTLQERLVDLETRLAKSKEEASMNAIALKRHITENLKLEEKLKQISQKCTWLEEECSLYFNDREVFMGVAEEAEERAFKAEERFSEAEKAISELLSEVQNFKRIQSEHATCKDEINRLNSKVQELEASNSDLQTKLSNAESQIAQNNKLQNSTDEPSVTEIDSQQCVCKEREGTERLMSEVQKLWKEIALYKCNLARTEIQVRILTDENKDLRMALRNRTTTLSSPPASKKGKMMFSNKSHNKSVIENGGNENATIRQPLGSLATNVFDLRR